MYNAGILGIANILDENYLEYDMKQNYIEFNKAYLDNFSQYYFNYFNEKYEAFTSWFNITDWLSYIENFDYNNIDENKIKYINKQLTYTKDKLKSNSYKNCYHLLPQTLDLLKTSKKLQNIKITKKKTKEQIVDEIKQQFDILRQIIDYLNTKEVKKHILAKNNIYNIIQFFWGNVSFLNSTANKKDPYVEFDKYFIKPIKNYMEQEDSKYKYKCFSCNNKIKGFSKPNSYDMGWLNKMGVDVERKTSHFYNFCSDTFVCPICNLVYACVPAGFTFFNQKGIFVNQNASIRTLIGVNTSSINQNMKMEELEEQTYFQVVESVKHLEAVSAKKEVDNIQIVKVDANNNTRPYTFNILSNTMLKTIQYNQKDLKKLVNKYVKDIDNNYINLYSEVINRLYENKNQFDLLYKLFLLKVQGKIGNLNYVKTIININNRFLGGIKGVKTINYKNVDEIVGNGDKLRNLFVRKNSENKINGLVYRLLNALKTKNTEMFLHNLIVAYNSFNEKVPTIFIETLKDESKFQSIGYAFLLGLQGSNEKNEKEEDNSDEE